MRFLLLLLAFAAAPCLAGKLYQCRDAQGNVSYVDHGCPGAKDRREITMVTADPTTKSRAAERDAILAKAWELESRSRLPPSLGGQMRVQQRRAPAPVERKRRVEPPAVDPACQDATDVSDTAYALFYRYPNRVQRVYGRVGVGLDWDQRKALADAIRVACKKEGS